MWPASILATTMIAAILAGCGGGQALIKDVQPLEVAAAVAQSSDDRVAVTIDAVIVRNARGAWASDADWDEYLVHVRSMTGEALTMKEVSVYDALDIRRAMLTDRGELVDASRDVEARYGQSGYLVKSQGVGWTVAGGTALVGAGVAASAAAVAGPALAASYGTSAAAASGAAATGAGLIIVGGVMIGSAVVRAVNNTRVNDEIQRRATRFPLALAGGGEAKLDVFVPLTPLPRAFEIAYADSRGEKRLRIDTAAALAEAHRELAPNPLLYSPEPRFPKEATRAGIESGFVRARLAIDGAGSPRSVTLTEVSHPGYFEEEAKRTLTRWRYTMGAAEERMYEVQLDFRR